MQNPNIILSGQPVNALAAITAGTQAAGLAGQVGQQGDILSLYRDQGAGIASGDQNALNALASLDPMASLGVQESRLGMDNTRQQMQAREQAMAQAREAGARAAQTHAASMTAAQRAQEAADTRRALEVALPALQQAEQTGDLTGLNQMLQAAELPPVNSVEEAYVMYMQIEGAVESLETFQDLTAGPEADWVTIDGQLVNRNAAGGPAAVPVNGLQPPAQEWRTLTPEEVANYPAPLDPNQGYQLNVDGGIRAIPGGGPDVVVNNNPAALADEYVSGMNEARVGIHTSILEQGAAANEMLGNLQSLAELAGQVNTGAGAVLTERLGPIAQALGVDIEGLSELQAFRSITERMAPAMRVPGSGASSDFEGRMFLNSLPSLMRTPEGNRIVNETLQAIQQHRLAAADIVRSAMMGDISPEEADRQIAALGTPFESFMQQRDQLPDPQGASGGQTQVSVPPPIPSGLEVNGVPATEDQWQRAWERMSPEQRALFE